MQITSDRDRVPRARRPRSGAGGAPEEEKEEEEEERRAQHRAERQGEAGRTR